MKHICKRTGQVLAVAALATMGTAHAYEWQINEDTTFGIGGDIELAYTIEDTGPGHERELIDNGSEIDFYGEHAFTDDLSAYFMAQFEFALDEAADGDNENSFQSDDVYFGVRSDNYGAVQIGDWDGIYDNHIEDLLDVFEVPGPTAAPQTPGGDSVAYFSPSFNGLSFAVQGFFKGEDNDPDNNDEGQSFQAVVEYEVAQYAFYLGYDDLGTDEGQDGTIGVGAGVDLAPVTLTAKVESVGEDSSPGGVDELDAEGAMIYGVAAAYDYGSGSIIGVINQVEPEADSLDSRTEFGVNVNYEIADNFSVYIEHFRYDKDHDEDNITATGLIYEF